MRFNGQALSVGTGFVTDSPIGPVLITNRHNVTGRDQNTNKPLSPMGALPNEIIIVHNKKVATDGSLQGWVERLEPLCDSAEQPLWREHPYLGSKVDFVALPLTNLEDVELYPYVLAVPGPQIALGPAEVVSVIGFPFGETAGGYFPVWATGFIASEPIVNYNDLPIILVDCRTREGQSGSPVIAFRRGFATTDRGQFAVEAAYRFVGIYSGRINRESDIGMVWKVSAIQELLASLAPLPTLPGVKSFIPSTVATIPSSTPHFLKDSKR